MFFASSEDAGRGDRYQLVIESARYADRHGFSSVWVPERHFGQWGGLYPSPSVLHAALARETKRVRLRAGSVVMPLHNPLRVAEEWSMVDHLSGGRVDLSFASGWNPADFALAPGHYAERHEAVFTGIETVKKLWRGETICVRSGDGREVPVRTYPSPLQKEVGIWVTAAGNPQTFIRAGQIGANVLTHLLDQGVEELGRKIKLYREARQSHGHDPASGQVSMMLHTFVGADLNAVKEQVRQPFCAYLKSISHLLSGLAQSRGRNLDAAKLSPADLDEFVNFLYERFFSTRAFLGTPESCRDLIGQLGAIGVNEVACLLDFGPTTEEILSNLPHLNRLRELCAEAGAKPRKTSEVPIDPPTDMTAIQARCPQPWTGEQFYETLARHGVQCAQSFRAIEQLWLGSGEALGRMAPTQALHPGFMDACFQVFAAAGLGDLADDALYLPKKLGRFQLVAGAGPAAWSHATVASKDATTLTGTVRILDAAGQLVAEATGLCLERAAAPKSTLDPWLYELSWEEARLTANARPGRWLIFADEAGVGENLAAILKSRGEEYIQVDPGQVPNEAPAMRRLIEENPGLTGVIHLWGLDAKPFETSTSASLFAEQQQGAGSALWIMQALAPTRTRLWLVTQGAQAVHGETQLSVSQSPLWGLGRTCAMEHPEIWGGLLDLDPSAPSADNARQILEVIDNQEGEDQVALRGNRRYVARLVHTTQGRSNGLSIKPDAGYVITGGLWGLGLEVARWLAGKGAKHLWLMGRSELPPRTQWPQLAAASRQARQASGILELEKLGVAVHYAPLDISDETAVRHWYLEKGPVAIRGVIHAASVWQDAAGQTLVRPLLSLDASAMQAVFAPKVTGSFVLHRVLGKTGLDFFVSFSSGASLVGSAGQGNYAAASAFLDALSQHRRLQGAPALSLNLGAVAQIGFGGTPEGRRVHEYWERHGIRRISPSDVLAALEQFVPQARAQIGVMHTDWPLLARSYPRLASLPWASKLIGRRSAVSAEPSELLRKLNGAPAGQRRSILIRHVREEVARIMNLPPSHPVDLRRGLFDMGMDSLMLLELKSRLQTSLGQEIPATVAFEFPTVEAIGGFLAGRLGIGGDATGMEAPAKNQPARRTDVFERIRNLSEAEVELKFGEKFSEEKPA